MANNGDIKFRLTLDDSDFVQGAARVRQTLRGFEADAKSLERAKGSVGGISTELAGLQALAARALPVAALGVATREFVQIADAYSSMTARLKLATRATGDFEQVQQALRKAADETRAPLQDTVNLYSQIAPSLQGILSSEEIIGFITTVNQAIALSGATGEQAGRGLFQFSQALSGGILRAEELNGVLEQTPALADAIAEGLGVTRGQLRKLVMEGEVTTERLVQAVRNVSGRVASDFKGLPVTVGQAFILLNNSIATFVGELDKGTGVTAGMANAIISVGSGIDALSNSKETLKGFTDVLINGFDLGARVFRVFGTAIAVTAAVLERLISLDVKGAFDTYKQGWKDIGAIFRDPLASKKADEQKPRREADARLEIQRKLANEIEKLEKLKAVAAGKASADTLKNEQQVAEERNKIARDAMNDRLRAEESTADKLRDLYAKSLTDAQKARDEAAKIRIDAATSADNLRDRASQRRGAGMSEGAREEMKTRAASSLTARATLAAGAAQVAARDGDLQKAAKLAADATKLAERAERAADAIKDDDTAALALEELARVQEKIGEAQAKQKEGEAAQLEKEATAIQEQIKLAEQRVNEFKAELAKPVTLSLDISEAEKQIKSLQAQLSALSAPKVAAPAPAGSGTAPSTPTSSGSGASGSWATGGYTGPGGKFDPAGVVHAGEYVLRQEVVRQAGMRAFLDSLNRNGVRALRGYSSGGAVTRIPRTGRVSPAASASQASVRATFNYPGLSPVQANIDHRTAQTLARELRREARKAGR